MRSTPWLGLTLVAACLVSGCGGNTSSVQPPSALGYTSTEANYTKGVAITPNDPTVTGGAATSYTVSPTLPAGLSLSAGGGVISGTPTVVTAKASYTVTASNLAGSTATTLAITVNDQPPSRLSYNTGTAIYAARAPIPPNSPASSGGAVTSYRVSPALPAGLSLSTSSGIIGGIPTTVTAKASYTVTGSNSGGSTTATLTITVGVATPPLSADNVNLIFVVSDDLAYHTSGDVNPSTANLTSQGLQRSLRMAPYLQQQVLGMKNVSAIYAVEPMTHLQTANNYPDMASLETIQQFAMLNQITLSSNLTGGAPYTGQSYPLNSSYAPGPLPEGVAVPPQFCPNCQGLDFNDQGGDNEDLVSNILSTDPPGFYVFSAPWETTHGMLININKLQGYDLAVPGSYQGPNYIYAISITPSGSASMVTYNTNLTPPSTYPALLQGPLLLTPCKATPFSITVNGGKAGAIIPAETNTSETLYIIRHADAHPLDYWDNNNYVGAGQWRALDLPNALRGKISPDQVYSIDPGQFGPGTVSASNDDTWSTVAPALTAEPYAIAKGLPYNLVTSFLISDATAPQKTSDFFFTGGKFSNQNVVLAWAYQFIQPTINALLMTYRGGQMAPAWSSDDYDSIWTVKLDSIGNLTVDNSLCEGISSARLPASPPQF